MANGQKPPYAMGEDGRGIPPGPRNDGSSRKPAPKAPVKPVSKAAAKPAPKAPAKPVSRASAKPAQKKK